jgi:hypothetical protein
MEPTDTLGQNHLKKSAYYAIGILINENAIPNDIAPCDRGENVYV